MNMKVMGRDPSLLSSLPETKLYTEVNFDMMIQRYETVILKPNRGGGGAGVMKVSRLVGGKYIIQRGAMKKVFSSRASTIGYINQYKSSKTYIVQRYIPLSTIDDSPFDLRVMVQRKKGVPWTITGKLAKVAGTNHFITNVARSRGYILPALSALTKSFSNKKAAAILKKLDRICLSAAKQLEAAYGFQTIGFDIAIDQKGNPWILESNSKPAISFFRKLQDKSFYRQMLDMAPSKDYRKHFMML
ncbi:YheC/YheD family protein [Ammoniphilus resinae]|uniref:Glutathione synthase/RimK-type ligase-like ATP-grasp enzyme n=1 Tax=Ammoniphilus resinae TaxID=861532 RepID=A0ABS4GW53_9BACL|nr:YheC/YheD family protein [Ammoniphilus resinae]MBP1934498.1 glutathione synthase/RimK-type ligase-like ATP-grasp enzyme [Ammoniphilus resinae]